MTTAADIKLFDKSLAFNEGRSLRILPRRIAFTGSIAYAEGARHTLDVCRPKTATAAPVIVFFYGGGWRSGSKRTTAMSPRRWRGAAMSPCCRTIASIHRRAIRISSMTAR